MGILQNIFKNKKKFNPVTLDELKALTNNNSIKLSDIDVSQLSSLEGLFFNSKRTDFSGIEEWDVSKVTNMRNMFKGCETFNEDISSWDVSKVRDMSNMFTGATNFNRDLSKWQISNTNYNAKFIKNMFSFADKMKDKILSVWKEKEQKGIEPEKIFSELPIPLSENNKKYVITPHTDLCAKEVFERVDDYKDLDTSALVNADQVLENSNKEELKNLADLDLSSVKSAKNFLKGFKGTIDPLLSTNYNLTFPNLTWADNMMQGSNCNVPIPAMPKVKSIDNLVADNSNYNADISNLSETKAKFADNAFNKAEIGEHLTHLSSNNILHKVTASSIAEEYKQLDFEQVVIQRVKHREGHSNTFGKDYSQLKHALTSIDPKNEYAVICVTNDQAIKAINELTSNSLERIDENSIYRKSNENTNSLGKNTFIIKKSDLNKIKNSNIKVPNEYYGTKAVPLSDNIASFDLIEYGLKFRMKEGECILKDTITFQDQIVNKNDKYRSDLDVESHFAIIKGLEAYDLSKEYPDLTSKNSNMMETIEDCAVKKINNFLETNPNSKKLVEQLINMSNNCDLNNCNQERYSSFLRASFETLNESLCSNDKRFFEEYPELKNTGCSVREILSFKSALHEFDVSTFYSVDKLKEYDLFATSKLFASSTLSYRQEKLLSDLLKGNKLKSSIEVKNEKKLDNSSSLDKGKEVKSGIHL